MHAFINASVPTQQITTNDVYQKANEVLQSVQILYMVEEMYFTSAINDMCVSRRMKKKNQIQMFFFFITKLTKIIFLQMF